MRLLIAIVIPAALIAASIATGQTSTDEPSIIPYETFAQNTRKNRLVGHAAQDKRCRPHTGFHFAQARPNVLPEKRAANMAYWKAKRERAQARSYDCFEQRMWTWYNTSGAKCVREHEGTWTSNTGNGYYGGFQADMSFQATYGGEYLARYGTANNWAPLYQVHMAYRGWLARGWSPWPTTSVMCGLA